MAGKTTIEWTAMPGYVGAVWNPTTGCTRVSAGCDNCYAFALHDKRYAMNLAAVNARAEDANDAMKAREVLEQGHARDIIDLPWPKQYDKPFSQVQLLEERIGTPLRVRKPTCWFVDSMADLFHEDVPAEFIARVFNVMGTATQHRFLVLTKRPERMYRIAATYYELTSQQPFANVWLGTSVEDQASADGRIPQLLATPAAVRFLSCEPLLGPVDLTPWIGAPLGEAKWRTTRAPLDWVIVGGESGPRARPMDLAWARSLKDQCAATGVSFFMKQLGSAPTSTYPEDLCEIDEENRGRALVREAHGRDIAEWPEDLRIRTWPR